jgi:hypothetical protein
MPGTKGDANQDSPSRDGAIDRTLEYLFTSSGASIESFHLSRLNAVANLRKELHEIFDEWVEAEVQARLAQGLLARKFRKSRRRRLHHNWLRQEPQATDRCHSLDRLLTCSHRNSPHRRG